MLFNKYQYTERAMNKRGYSQTCIVTDESGKNFWVKWILGIEKSSTKSKILADKLRYLQKVQHSVLPQIVEYGYDEEQQTFAIVYQYLSNSNSFEDKYFVIESQEVIGGLLEIANCLNELHQKYKINHGDIHPDNILIDENGQFYLIDFGLADITKTLSQESHLEIFAKEFAAPEKMNRFTSQGFPFQADIYSFGKVIDWYFHQKQEIILEEQNKILQRLLAENPSDRPNWQQVIDFLKKFATFFDTGIIQIAFRNNNFTDEFWQALNNSKPIFDVAPKKDGEKYKMNIIVGDYFCEYSSWIKEEGILHFDIIKPLDSLSPDVIKAKKRDSKKLPFRFSFSYDYIPNKANLTPYFQKWFEVKELAQRSKKAGKEELGFYRELLEEEKKVIAKNSLRLQYYTFKASVDEITFKVKLNEKYSSIGQIKKHIDEGNDANSEGFGYVISANADRKQNKGTVEFVGKPYELEPLSENDKQNDTEKEYEFKIKDCEHLKKDNIPQSGYLFENTAQKEEEKNRQLDAIRKVERNEVQNPDLIYFLFKPNELQGNCINYEEEQLNVWQKDNDGKPFEYSYNQNKAIKNALLRTPMSVIQGPPGTGKTTVITEIVFQILDQKPEAKILITSQTNNAVDQVLENLLKNNIPILRLSGLTAPKVPSIKEHTMEKKLSGWKKQVRETAEKNFKKRIDRFKKDCEQKNQISETIIDILIEQKEWDKTKTKIENIVGRIQNLNTIHSLPNEKAEAITLLGSVLNINLAKFMREYDLYRDWINTITALDEKSAINQKLIDSIRVIGATCNHIAAKKYSKYNFEFDYVIMDESGKATTAEALVPIILGKNLIFVGDHRQLRPMLTSTREVEVWLRDKFKKEAEESECWEDYFNRPSLFEQVITNIDEDFKAQLTECRRSSKEQVLLTSQCFYEPEGDEQIEPVERDNSKEHNLPLTINSSVIFVDIGSNYKNEKDNNNSSFNKKSAQLIPEILEYLNKCEEVKKYSFGIITGYTAQYRKLKKYIDEKRYQNKLDSVVKWKNYEEKVTVSVVDRFQGLERDIVIVDLVKSGAGLDLGFLETPNRINVALSRQKRLLIIVGDYHGIINAKTRRCNGKKAALQLYLEKIKPEWIIKAEQIKSLFPKEFSEQKQQSPQIDIVDFAKKEYKQDLPTINSNVSLNINTRDISALSSKSNETWLTNNKTNPKRAVLELSTKAVKLLINLNSQILEDGGFDFNECFLRQSVRTETGMGLDKNNKMDMEYFQTKVLPSILESVQIAKDYNVDVLHTVATAAYRTATNRDDLVNLIEKRANIHVRILSKKEESTAALWAYIFSTKNRDAFLKANNILMIDQGGGSTEISIFQKQQLAFSHSLGIGTTVIKNKLFQNLRLNPIDAFAVVDKFSMERIHKELQNSVPKYECDYCVGIGRAITIATGKYRNEEQHDCRLTIEDLESFIDFTNKKYSKYDTISDLSEAAKDDRIEKEIVARIGLPIILEIMRYFSIEYLTVSGTALWYGVFFKEFHNLK